MTGQARERRRLLRRTVAPQVIRLQLDDHFKNPRWVTADLLDISEGGIGISMLAPLAIGSKIVVRGELGASRSGLVNPATVRWCTEDINGTCHAGLEFEDGSSRGRSDKHSTTIPPAEELDCYETMQLSPNADPDTIQRVYRVLAQRYHPDTMNTGNSEMFVRLCEAYGILNSPELRAQYDVLHREARHLRWKIFDQAEAGGGPDAERCKRRRVLELLYAKALHDPERATMTVFDFEQILGCRREDLVAAFWYLKGKGYVQRCDNGRLAITVQGFDEVERADAPGAHRSQQLLEPHTEVRV